MMNTFGLILRALVGLLRSKAALQVLVLRRQLDILRRKSPKMFVLTGADRAVFVTLYCLVPGVMDALAIIRPETAIRWRRAGFRRFWRWKARRGGGRPKVSVEIRNLIRGMSVANPLWGAPRIHGELLKLEIDVGQTSVAKYMPRRRRPPSQGWKTFLTNHADGIAAMVSSNKARALARQPSHNGTSCAANSQSATFFAPLSALAVLVIPSMLARFANV